MFLVRIEWLALIPFSFIWMWCILIGRENGKPNTIFSLFKSPFYISFGLPYPNFFCAFLPSSTHQYWEERAYKMAKLIKRNNKKKLRARIDIVVRFSLEMFQCNLCIGRKIALFLHNNGIVRIVLWISNCRSYFSFLSVFPLHDGRQWWSNDKHFRCFILFSNNKPVEKKWWRNRVANSRHTFRAICISKKSDINFPLSKR